MSIGILSLLMMFGFIALILLGLPLAFSTGAVATITTFIVLGPDSINLTIFRMFDVMNNYVLVAVPLFVFMAYLLQQAGIAEQMYTAVYIWSGPIRGGLAIATIIVCAIMAAMVGIIGAEIVTLGVIAVPTMLKRNYHRDIALGSVCAGGGLATLIPPSILFIVYALATGTSVGKLFLAGVVPGILLSCLYIVYIIIRCLINPELAPSAPSEERELPFAEKVKQLKGLVLPLSVVFAIFGSMYMGIATPTEAAGVGCIGGFACCLVNRRLTYSVLKEVVYNTTKVTAMVYWLLFGTQMVVALYNRIGGARFVQDLLQGLPLGWIGLFILMQVIWIILGGFIDFMGILLLTVPLFLPVVTQFGYDPIWFGVVFCLNMQISYISPPFAPSAFYLKGVVKEDITLTQIYRSSVPYVFLILIALALITIFPDIALWLPRHAR